MPNTCLVMVPPLHSEDARSVFRGCETVPNVYLIVNHLLIAGFSTAPL